MPQPQKHQLTPATINRDAGEETLALLQAPEESVPLLAGLDERAPGFPDWILNSVFGGTYQRAGLKLRDRQLLNLGALAALGGVEPQLRGHVTSSLRVGLSETEVIEALVHLAPYIGLPKTLAALRAANDALAKGEEAQACRSSR